MTAATTGTTAAGPSNANTTAVNTYKTYVAAQTAQLVTETQKFVDAVKAGNVNAAKAQFAAARAPYETIEPIAESFGDLDPEIDAREGDVPTNEWGGFHRIEKQLWVNGNTAGMAPVADKLLTDVKTLNSKIAGLELEPARNRERRGRALERGREEQDHRRGRPLFAHRPLRFRGQCAGCARSVHRGEADRRREAVRPAGGCRRASSRRC